MLKSSSTNRRCDRGAVMVEFAIIAPLLILIVFGITELGRALYQENILTHAVQTGARYMTRIPDILVLNEDGSCSVDATGWGSAETNAKKLIVYGDLDGSNPILPNLTVDGADGKSSITFSYAQSPSESISACVIKVSAEVIFAGVFGPDYSLPPIPFIGPSEVGGFGTITLNAKTEERYIGE